MLLERDISTFNTHVLPENTYLTQLQEDMKHPIEKFMEQLESDEYTGSMLYDRYTTYCNKEGYYIISSTKFPIELLFLKENGTIKRSINKERTKQGVRYIIK